MDKLLSITASRKALIGLLTTLATTILVIANKKLELGLSTAEIAMAAGVAATTGAAVILGIAIEDNGEKSRPTGNGKIVPLLLFVLLPFIGGCFTIHERDDTTIAHVDRTIEAREADFSRCVAEVEKSREAALSAQQYAATIRVEAEARGLSMRDPPLIAPVTTKETLAGLKAIQESELTRLRFWAKYERAKKDKDQ